jgi:hypothetical protein
MSDFPRTIVGGVSVSRMIAGTNWLLGFSHCTQAKDALINDTLFDHKKIADVFEVFLRAGVDTIMGQLQTKKLADAIHEAEDRTGIKAITVSTPGFSVNRRTPVDGFDMDEVNRILDVELERGATFCMPHTSTTDRVIDHCTREIRKIDQLCAAIRERGMIPGLSTHLPEAIIYADETGLDVEAYTAMFNAMGFLMPLEVDWTAQIMRDAKKPVMTIKPMAAGQIRPLQALTFVWNAIRDQDMVAVGTMTPREAAEVIEMSLAVLERRQPAVPLQETRSKAPLKPAQRTRAQ